MRVPQQCRPDKHLNRKTIMSELSTTRPTGNSHSSLRSVATVLLTIAVLVLIAFTAWKLNQRNNLYASVTSFAFFAATGLAIVYRIANSVGWNCVVRGMGHRVTIFQTTQIWLLSESRRWFPGGIWGYASRAVASQQIGLTKTAATASMAIELLATITAAAIVSIAGVVIYYGELRSTASNMWNGLALDTGLFLIVAVGGLATFVAAWRLRHKVLRKFDALYQIRIDPKWLVGAIGYFVAMAILNGAVNSVLLSTVSTMHVPWMAMVAATATAWIIGFFAFFSPGGILVREAALAMLLTPWLPYETGFALAMLSRFAQLVAEFAGMGLTFVKCSRVSVSQS